MQILEHRMGRPLTVTAHLAVEEVERRMLAAKDAFMARRWQVVWLALRGKGSKEIMDVTTFSRDWVFQIVRAYNREGPAGLQDGRASNGAKAMLSDDQIEQLVEALHGEPAQGGLWSGPKVAHWMSEVLGRKVADQRGWDYLQRLGFRLKVARPTHADSSEEAKEAFKRGGSRRPSSRSNETTPMQPWRRGPRTRPGSD